MNGAEGMVSRIRHEISLLSRFTIVGIAATVVHIVLVWFLIAQNGVSPYIANAGGFLLAFMVSFTGQYYWTFISSQSLRVALGRFFLVSSLAFFFNNVVLAALLSANVLPPVTATVIAAGAIPLFTYFLARFWAMR